MKKLSQEHKYSEWMEKIKKVSGQHQKEEISHAKEIQEDVFHIKPYLWQAGLVFAIALIPRLLYLFVFSDPNIPGWYTDVYHHWQIAYLSKEIGFSHGFLRLWDFKGMEFFWGLLHPLVLVILFTITGSISIIVPRLLSAFGGSISIVLIFLIIRKYFNKESAWAAALFASFFPLAIFSNTAGMQEELAVPLILTGILLWPRFPIFIGVLLALASMVRSEYWLFSFGLIMAAFLLKFNRSKALIMFLTYALIIIVYMKYLASWTGNYIYPIYWNFLASAKGDWLVDLPIIGEKLLARTISRGIFAFGAIGALWTIIKKPKYGLFFLFGFGNIIFIGFMVGFGAYVRGYIPRFWVDRLYNWPYLFTGILVILFLFYFLPKTLPLFGKLKLNWLILAFGIAAAQWIWNPINYFMIGTKDNYKNEREVAQEISRNYQEGTILLPEDRPNVIYFLAHDFGIKGKNMEGQMFDPFFYFPNQDNLFSNWGMDRIKVLSWLKKDNIKLIVLTAPKKSYLGLIDREGKYFKRIPSKNLFIYEVNIK